jgi:hypothetical protein
MRFGQTTAKAVREIKQFPPQSRVRRRYDRIRMSIARGVISVPDAPVRY